MTASLAHELISRSPPSLAMRMPAMRLIDKAKEDPETLRDILVDRGISGHRAHDIIQNVRNTIKKGDPSRHPINLNELVTK